MLITAMIMAALALLTQSLSSIDLIIENRASLIAFLKITSLALPQLFSIVLPFAVFVSVAFAIQRLHTDNEIMVLYAAGMTQWQVISPVLRVVSFAVLVNLILNLFVQPLAFRSMRETIYDVRSDLASSIIRPGEFVSPAVNLTIFARELSNGVMRDVLIYDGRDQEKPITFLAKSGVFANVSDRPSITLNNASRQSLSSDGVLEFLEFSSTSFEMTGVIDPQGDLLYKYSDRYISELFHPDQNDYWQLAHVDDLKAEGHYRLSSPLYNFALCLLALTALLAGDINKMGYSRRLISFGVIALLVRLTGFSLESAAADAPALNSLQYILPILVCGICGYFLFRSKRVPPPTELAQVS
ncbi:MAG: LPS export ABC transporter permease LptF [Robiginitomaculum sp.]|nr:MAG: LPS export ABC transporter permease LptF [Robiginitomaculum sp.]